MSRGDRQPVRAICNDCGVDITSQMLTHDCDGRRTRLANEAVNWARAESQYMFAGGLIVITSCVTAVYAAYKAQPWSCGMLLALAIFAAVRSHVAEKESIRWVDKALDIVKGETK